MAPVLSLDNPLVRTYAAYAALLCLKVLFLSVYTGLTRFRKGVFANPEDAASKKGAKVKYDDVDVERVRRAHLNDLENIPVFFVLALLYILTGPSEWLATTLFRIFAAGRILHTVVYAVVVVPQPARAIGFGIPYLINWYMGIQVIGYFLSAL